MQRIKDKTHEIIEKAGKKFNLEIPKYTVLVNLTGNRTLGQYQVKGFGANAKHTLRFHPKAFFDCPEAYEETIIHEVAHFIVFLKYGYNKNIKPHGEEWKNIAKELGLKDPRAINKNKVFDLKKPERKICYCPCMEHKVSTRMYNIIKRGDSPRICKNCEGILKIEPYKE